MEMCMLYWEQQCCPWSSKLKGELIVYPYLGEGSDKVVASLFITPVDAVCPCLLVAWLLGPICVAFKTG